MLDHRSLAERFRAIHKVLPHEILRKGEVSEHHLLDNFESWRILYGSAHPRPNGGDVDPVPV